MENYKSPLLTNLTPVVNSVITSVSASEVTTTIVADNLLRKMVLIYNNSSNSLFLKLGSTASNDNFTVKMPPHSLFELPFPVYTGVITGIWDGISGSAKVTELF